MNEPVKLIAFILLIVGTLGLLLNELLFRWGTAAVLMFALLNVVGLAMLAVKTLGCKK